MLELELTRIPDLAWLFWMPVAFLFAESWARAWASRRASRSATPRHEGACCVEPGA